MKKAPQQTAFILLRELSWRCFGHRIYWRRLFLLLVVVLSVSGFVFQMLVHSYVTLPNKLFPSPHETDLLSYSYQSSNSTTIQPNGLLRGARLQQVHPTLPNSVVSTNSSNKFAQSVAVEWDGVEARARRKNMVSGSKRDKNLAGTTKITISSFPHRHVPSGKQVEVDEILNLLISFFKYDEERHHQYFAGYIYLR